MDHNHCEKNLAFFRKMSKNRAKFTGRFDKHQKLFL